MDCEFILIFFCKIIYCISPNEGRHLSCSLQKISKVSHTLGQKNCTLTLILILPSFCTISSYVFDFSSLDALLSFKQGAANSDVSDTHAMQLNESSSEKRRLRSHKNTEENEFILDLGAVTQQTSEKNCNAAQATQMSSLSLLKQMLPANIAVPLKTRELLQDILAWKLLPSDAPVEPSQIYGAVHLSRLIVKLPDFINATPMSDEKLKLLLQNIDNFIEYVFKIELKMKFFST